MRDYCNANMTLMSFDLRRSTRYRWPSRRLPGGKSCDRSPVVKTTRYAAIVLTWAYSRAPDSMVDDYYRVSMVKRPIAG